MTSRTSGDLGASSAEAGVHLAGPASRRPPELAIASALRPNFSVICSAYRYHGGTWGIPGGALHRGETPEDGARREAVEEFGTVPDYAVAEVIADDARGWTNSTVVADVATPVDLEPVTWEHTTARWVTPEEATHLPLHPGLSVAGLALRASDNRVTTRVSLGDP